MHISRLSRADIVHDLDASLANLQTDVIDLYWLHRDDPQRPVGEIVETLNEQVRWARSATWAVRTGSPRASRPLKSMRAACSAGLCRQPDMWSLAAPDRAALGDKTMGRYGRRVPALPHADRPGGDPLLVAGQRLLSEAGCRRVRGDQACQARVYGTAENRERFGRIQKLRADTGLSVSQVVLGYLQSQPFTTIPIVGCRTPSQLADSLAAGDVRLTQEQVRFLERGD